MSSWRNTALAAIGCVVAAGMWTAPASAQAPGDWDGLVNRINRLQEQIYDLRDAGGGGAVQLQGTQIGSSEVSANPADEASLTLRLNSVEDQLRQLTGQIQEIGFQVQQLSERFKRFSEDVEFRFQELGSGKRGDAGRVRPLQSGDAVSTPASIGSGGVSGSLLEQDDGQPLAGGGSLTTAAPPRVLGTIPAGSLNGGGTTEGATIAGRSLVPESVISQPLDSLGGGGGGSGGAGPEDLYKLTHEKLLRRQFDEAEIGFKQFLRKYPDHNLAGNAQYWLGETFYARRQYKLAAEAFLKGYQDHSKGAKAADSLVKLGMTLDRLGQQKQACAALVEAERRYPKAREVRKIAAKERTRVGCR